MKKSISGILLVGLAAFSFSGYLIAEPAFHQVLTSSPNMASYLYSNQIQQESKVENGVIYTRQHPGAEAENGFAQVLQATLPKFDSRFAQGISAYWTVQIRLARKNPKSKWHNYAKNLPTGIQTIKRRIPTNWMSERVTGWSDVRSFKVLVY
jgi:hypothetical protein